MAGKHCAIVTALAAIVLIPAGATAQTWQQRQTQMQQPSTSREGIEQEVRSFLKRAEESVTRAVQQGDQNALRQLTENYVADSASFSTMMEVTGNSRTAKAMRMSMTDKQDLLRRQAALMSLMPDLLNRVQNYDLNIRVLNVEPISDSAAIVKTRITESASISSLQFSSAFGDRDSQAFTRQGMSGSSQADQSTAATGAGGGQQASSSQQQSGSNWAPGTTRPVSFNGVAECTQLIRRSDTENHMVIGMSNCSAELSN
jgi:hypothetical protein